MDSLDNAFEDIDNLDTSSLDFGDELIEEIEDTPQDIDTPPAEDEPEELEEHAEEDEPEPTDVEPEEDEPAPKKDIRIPKSRLDGEIAKRRKAEDEARQLKEFIQRLTAPSVNEPAAKKEPEVSVDDLIRAEHEALIEGDLDKALTIRKQAQELERQQYSRQVMEQVQSVDSNIKDELMFNQRLSQVVQEFPVFDETSEVYNENIARAALQLGNSYVAQGHSRTDALNLTLETLAPAIQAMNAPKPQAAPQAQTRNLDAKLKAAKSQPPRTGGNGSNRADDPTINPTKIDVDEWENLPQSVRDKFLV